MSDYRFYSVDVDGHIDAPAFVAELPSDEAAKQHATALINGRDIEIWDGSRRVAVVNKGCDIPGLDSWHLGWTRFQPWPSNLKSTAGKFAA